MSDHAALRPRNASTSASGSFRPTVARQAAVKVLAVEVDPHQRPMALVASHGAARLGHAPRLYRCARMSASGRGYGSALTGDRVARTRSRKVSGSVTPLK